MNLTKLRLEMINCRCYLVYLFSVFTYFCQAQEKMLPICQSLEEIKQYKNQRVLVLGQVALAFHLPKHPYILLLKNKEWLFLGNEEVLQGVTFSGPYVLIEGVVQASNPNFNLTSLKKAPLDARYLRFSGKLVAQVKAPEQVIQSHPYFTKIHKIQDIPQCQTKDDLSKHLHQWVVMFGLLSVKPSSTLLFRTSKKDPTIDFTLPLQNRQLKGKNNLGMIVAKFDKINAPPKETLLQQPLVVCKTKAQVKKHLGEIVALSARVKRKGTNKNHPFLKIGPKTLLYVYSFPKELANKKMANKKIYLITSIYRYGMPLFFEEPLVFSRIGVGQVGYIKSQLWFDY